MPTWRHPVNLSDARKSGEKPSDLGRGLGPEQRSVPTENGENPTRPFTPFQSRNFDLANARSKLPPYEPGFCRAKLAAFPFL